MDAHQPSAFVIQVGSHGFDGLQRSSNVPLCTLMLYGHVVTPTCQACHHVPCFLDCGPLICYVSFSDTRVHGALVVNFGTAFTVCINAIAEREPSYGKAKKKAYGAQKGVLHGGCSQPKVDPEGCLTVSRVVQRGEGSPLPPLVAPNLGGRWVAQTYIPQKDPHDALIILNTHKWGRIIFHQKSAHQLRLPSAKVRPVG